MKSLINIQKFLNSKKFEGGSEIMICSHDKTIAKKVPKHVKRMYYYMHQCAIGQKTARSAACKIIENLCFVDQKKSILRHESHQDFYSMIMSKPKNRIFNIKVMDSLDQMLSYIDAAYPPAKVKTSFFSRNIPVEVEKMRQIIVKSKAQSSQHALCWGNLKKILCEAHACSSKIKFSHRQKTFFKKMSSFLVLDEPILSAKKALSKEEIERISNENEESEKIAKDISKTIKRMKSKKKMEENTVTIYPEESIEEEEKSKKISPH